MKRLTQNSFLPFITAIRWTYIAEMILFVIIPAGIFNNPFFEEITPLTRSSFHDIGVLFSTPFLFIAFYLTLHFFQKRYPRALSSFLLTIQIVAVVMFFSVFVFQFSFFKTHSDVFCLGDHCTESAGFMIYDPLGRIIWSRVVLTWIALDVGMALLIRMVSKNHVQKLSICTKAISLLFTFILIAPFLYYLYENSFVRL